MFNTFDSDHDGVLTKEDREELFFAHKDYPWSESAQGGCVLWEMRFRVMISAFPEFPRNCEHDYSYGITIMNWICEWQLLVRTDLVRTISSLLLFGWKQEPSALLKRQGPAEEEWQEYGVLRHSVIHAFVFGCDGVGKVTPEIGAHSVVVSSAAVRPPPDSHVDGGSGDGGGYDIPRPAARDGAVPDGGERAGGGGGGEEADGAV